MRYFLLFSRRSLQLSLLFFFLVIPFSELVAQQFNANYQPVSFRANSRKTVSGGGDGTSVGNVIRYDSVIIIGGQRIDCVVRTVSLTNATFTLPGGAPAGTNAHDYASSTGTSMSNNKDSFFSPMFNFGGAGSCAFEFQFILGGTYTSTTPPYGTSVGLRNVYVNTYDIDGNGGTNSNQYNTVSLSGLNWAQYGGNIDTFYNTSPNPTAVTFRSTTNANTVDVLADAHRIRILYDTMRTVSWTVGADGSGAAYFFIDFSVGPNFTVPPDTIVPLPVDLISFNGFEIRPRTVRLNWSTASELNNSHFQIERSTDGNAWEILESVPGHGTTQEIHHYEYLDHSPHKGVNYYRLRQFDYDGKFEVSPVVPVHVGETETTRLSTYLNADNNELKINYKTPVSEQVNVTLSDLSGIQVKKIFNGELKSAEQGYWNVDISDLAGGIYLLNYHSRTENKTIKVNILR